MCFFIDFFKGFKSNTNKRFELAVSLTHNIPPPADLCYLYYNIKPFYCKHIFEYNKIYIMNNI